MSAFRRVNPKPITGWNKMRVINRQGLEEPIRIDAILERNQQLLELESGNSLNSEFVDIEWLSFQVMSGLTNLRKTRDLDIFTAEEAASKAADHYDWSRYAGRVLVSDLHKSTKDDVLETMELLYNTKHPKRPELSAAQVSDVVMAFMRKHKDRIQSEIDYDWDYQYDYFAVRTLINQSYLSKDAEGNVIQRPQHMLMLVACGVVAQTGSDDIDLAMTFYNMLKERLFIGATPILLNAGRPNATMGSCFMNGLLDNIVAIYQAAQDYAIISKGGGGMGFTATKVRANGSYITGTNGRSSGIMPMLRVFNATARYVDQGGGKRKGAFAVYLEPWHADLLPFLEMRKNHGDAETRCRDLFYGLWIPNLFMDRVDQDQDWSFFCPNEAPGLAEAVGDDFDKLYKQYEMEGRARSTVRAKQVWKTILATQSETGGPYMCYKDAMNRRSNQRNIGTILCSNLCTEMAEAYAQDEIASCNLSSIPLCNYLDKHGNMDFPKLGKTVKHVVIFLNMVIDGTKYFLDKIKTNNQKYRPLGIGIQALQNLFFAKMLPFDSKEARKLNRQIFEVLYYFALEASHELAKQRGRPHDGFETSPLAQGKFQFDLAWEYAQEMRKSYPDSAALDFDEDGKSIWLEKERYMPDPELGLDWEGLRHRIMHEGGVLNSLLIAPMPTATTASITGINGTNNVEAFEPINQCIYLRRTASGEFIVVVKELIDVLIKYDLWTEEIRTRIINNAGSIQDIEEIPEHVRKVFRTVFEIPQSHLLEMAFDRGLFICQSQSMNIHMKDTSEEKLSAMHFYGWRMQAKTGMYYLRTKPACDPFKIENVAKDLSSAVAAKYRSTAPSQHGFKRSSGGSTPATLLSPPSERNTPAEQKELEEKLAECVIDEYGNMSCCSG